MLEDIMDRLTKGMATRRGFIRTMGKVAAGVAAAMTGGLIHSDMASANNLLCCTGTYCGYTHCPSGSSVDYTWCCRYYAGPQTTQSPSYIGVICNDCCKNGNCKDYYICTYPTGGGAC